MIKSHPQSLSLPSGVASVVANAFIDLGNSLDGTTPVLIAIYVATALLSELLTNNAAGLIMYPIVSTRPRPSPACDWRAVRARLCPEQLLPSVSPAGCHRR